MTAHTSTAAAVLSRLTLLRHGAAMAARAVFSPVTAAAMRTGSTREKATTMQTAATQLETPRARPQMPSVPSTSLCRQRRSPTSAALLRLGGPTDTQGSTDPCVFCTYLHACAGVTWGIACASKGRDGLQGEETMQYRGRMHYIAEVAVARAGTIMQVRRAFPPACAHQRTKPFTPVSLDTLLRHVAVLVTACAVWLGVLSALGQAQTEPPRATKKENTMTQAAATQLSSGLSAAKDAIRPFHVSIPEEALVDLRRRIAATRWPDKEEVIRAQEVWARRAFSNLIYLHEADRGGHFAMWESPELFATELRAAFKPLRTIESAGRQ
jgi:hypothetical protein